MKMLRVSDICWTMHIGYCLTELCYGILLLLHYTFSDSLCSLSRQFFLDNFLLLVLVVVVGVVVVFLHCK